MRLLIALLAVAFAVLQFRLWLSEGGIREVWRLDDQVARRTEENERLAERNSALDAEVQDLKKGLAAAEERARSELGMVLPNERFYQIMPFPAAVSSTRPSAVETERPKVSRNANTEQDAAPANAGETSVVVLTPLETAGQVPAPSEAAGRGDEAESAGE